MNMKNPRAHLLARELARLTGESVTEAVTIAVEERLERLHGGVQTGLADRLLEIGRNCATHLKEPYHSIDHADLLYDQRGLPK